MDPKRWGCYQSLTWGCEAHERQNDNDTRTHLRRQATGAVAVLGSSTANPLEFKSGFAVESAVHKIVLERIESRAGILKIELVADQAPEPRL